MILALLNEKNSVRKRNSESARHSFPFYFPLTIRLVLNEAFHMKLFFSLSAGVQLGLGGMRGGA